MNTALIVLYPVFFFLMLSKGKNRNNHKFYNIIVLFFFVAGIASVYICNTFYTFKNLKMDFGAICYHLIMMFLLIIPLKSYDRKSLLPITEANNVVYYFTYFIIVLFLIYIIDGVQYVSFDTILQDVQGLRVDLVESDYLKGNIFMRYVDYIVKSFTFVPLGLMFYFMLKNPDKKLLIASLFICSFGFVVVSLRFAAREFLIKYLFVAFCFYFIFRDRFSKQWRNSIRYFGIVLSVISIFMFLLITFLRFEETGNGSSFENIAIYFGQSFAFFSEGFVEFPNGMFSEKGTLCFPLFAGSARSVFNMNDQLSTMIHLNVFRTTIGSWTQDCGAVLTVFITIIYALIIRLIGKQEKQNAFTFVYLSWVFEFIFSLLFFFEMGITAVRLAVYVITISLDYASRSNKQITVNSWSYAK